MMTLKSIELNGFKSFGKKSEVLFTTPVVAIVGPNGSGKSNIVEAMRFVLGEQSMKSLRGKGGVDLIFKGSKGMAKSNRASVTIFFDNSKKIFSFTNSGAGVSLDYDEISISREVYPDGVNKYSINNTEVRLKDVIDLLASVNIGSSGHHIISQGEADKVLNASSRDRRAMIEDALGLKIYQYRIKESERKLEKTILNMREVGIARKEIAPHLNFLKKQAEKAEKVEFLQQELSTMYKEYFFNEGQYINFQTKNLTQKRKLLNEKMASIEDRILRLGDSGDSKNSPNNQSINEKKKEIEKIRMGLSDLTRALGRLEGMIDGIKDTSDTRVLTERKVSITEWDNLISLFDNEIDKALNAGNLESVISILKSLKEKLNIISKNDTKDINDIKDDQEKYNNRLISIEFDKKKILSEIENLKKEEEKTKQELHLFEELDHKFEESLREGEKLKYELMREKNEINSDLQMLKFEEEKLVSVKTLFEKEINEAQVLIGSHILSSVKQGYESDMIPKIERSVQEDFSRKIERIKIKLEDSGVGNSKDIIKEYEETKERDEFLAREIEDLNNSIKAIRDLIKDLKDTLYSEFKTGVEKINRQFQEFFVLMFGGGSASLSVVVENKRNRKGEDDEMEEFFDDPSEAIELEKGIEINVSLPHKKVRDLHMLSGGERSLASIALLFAISQVNPPPFLVLDETDAALDEANSRKYGNMLENLSKYSQLIVVTHNRETMSRAQILYGVTMDSNGVSKLLSVKLDDAEIYAK